MRVRTRRIFSDITRRTMGIAAISELSFPPSAAGRDDDDDAGGSRSPGDRRGVLRDSRLAQSRTRDRGKIPNPLEFLKLSYNAVIIKRRPAPARRTRLGGFIPVAALYTYRATPRGQFVLAAVTADNL